MKKILVVDDDDKFRKAITYALKGKGYEVFEADNGVSGLEAAAAQKPDLILSDVIMDNMNGFMMVEALQKDPTLAKIPVVMMTGAAQEAGAWKAEHALEYLEKPFPISRLFEVVERTLIKKV